MSRFSSSAPDPSSSSLTQVEEPPEPSDQVNYDEDALLELTVGDEDYRLDSGKAGTALCISTRESGTWRWRFLGEARWDGSSLRSRGLERPLLDALARELRAVSDREG